MTPTENTLPGPKRAKARRHARRWLPVLGAIVLLGLIVAGLWPQPVPVEVANATVGVLQATINEDGKTRIKHRFLVSAPVAGQLQRIELKAGAEVKAGEVVAIIDPLAPTLLDARSRILAEARRDAAASNLEKANAALAFAANELQRFRRLRADGAVSVQELDVVELRDSTARKDAATAESAMRQAEAELAEFLNPGEASTARKAVELKAPATGAVLRVIEESSRTVMPGTPLLEIGDPTDLEIVIDVLSRDGAAIVPGTRIYLEQWGGPEPLEARVRLVEPAAFTKISALGVEEQRVNVVADFVTPPEKRRSVGDNFRVEARVVAWETDRALKVPAGALFRRGEQWGTFVLSNGAAKYRAVKTGRSSGAETQILDGLKEGEQVILYPGSRIADGQRVKVIKV